DHSAARLAPDAATALLGDGVARVQTAALGQGESGESRTVAKICATDCVIGQDRIASNESYRRTIDAADGHGLVDHYPVGERAGDHPATILIVAVRYQYRRACSRQRYIDRILNIRGCGGPGTERSHRIGSRSIDAINQFGRDMHHRRGADATWVG